MRIVFQGSLHPEELGQAVEEIIAETLAEVEGTELHPQMLHNPTVETNLNVVGFEKPVLVTQDDENLMFTVHTGFKDGEFTEYVAPDKEELLKDFHEAVEQEENANKE
ncbi:hypothetical protein [Geomicrobium sp. JCM 19055]|uniref:hypothetical protein n=1 Tax=Geomicrobium sp. JCM 19055 TaxID=1460649 RepID=UPI00045ED6CA|nr:hypothetical protein [Geomicrobium sp. JCM 19055]GAK00872.1 hypothetical protein JCM19055_3991 [Geomicrobium sp. JCM 19055]